MPHSNRSVGNRVIKTLRISVVVLSTGASAAAASTVYTYDQLGRLTTAAYDNGLCIAYSYDANGNRTSINSASAAG
jgi:hypothetical protein